MQWLKGWAGMQWLKGTQRNASSGMHALECKQWNARSGMQAVECRQGMHAVECTQFIWSSNSATKAKAAVKAAVGKAVKYAAAASQHPKRQ